MTKKTRHDVLKEFISAPIFLQHKESDWLLQCQTLRGIDVVVSMAILSKGSTQDSIKIHMLVTICGAVKIMKTVVIDFTDGMTEVYVSDSRYPSFDRELVDIVRKWINQQAENEFIYESDFIDILDGRDRKKMRIVLWVCASMFAGFCLFCTWFKIQDFMRVIFP